MRFSLSTGVFEAVIKALISDLWELLIVLKEVGSDWDPFCVARACSYTVAVVD